MSVWGGRGGGQKGSEAFYAILVASPAYYIILRIILFSRWCPPPPLPPLQAQTLARAGITSIQRLTVRRGP